MHTLKVDTKNRVRLPNTKPGQYFSIEPQGDGSLVLVPVKEPKRKEMFPPGSLVKYFTAEKNREEMELLKGCVGPTDAE